MTWNIHVWRHVYLISACSYLGSTPGHHRAGDVFSAQWNGSTAVPRSEPGPKAAKLYAPSRRGCILVPVPPRSSQLFPRMPI
jgi:hypothetical protein